MTSTDTLCPCGSSKLYRLCCQPLHLKAQYAGTAEQLMRSRFCAFYFRLWDYLYHTGPRDEGQAETVRGLRQWAADKTWLALSILDSHQGTADWQSGTVEFVAFYRRNAPTTGAVSGAIEQHHELSQFRQIDGQWRFVDGRGLPPVAVGRNLACPCGSGKKFKRCCS